MRVEDKNIRRDKTATIRVCMWSAEIRQNKINLISLYKIFAMCFILILTYPLNLYEEIVSTL